MAGTYCFLFLDLFCRLAAFELNDAAAAAAAAAAPAAPDAATIGLPVAMEAACAPHDEISAQLVVLKKLQTDGVISSEEFENKKAELLGRM